VRASDQLVVASVFVNPGDAGHEGGAAVLWGVASALRAQCREQLRVAAQDDSAVGPGGAHAEGDGDVVESSAAVKKTPDTAGPVGGDTAALVGELSQVVQEVIGHGRSVFLVVDGLPAHVAPLAARAVLDAHKCALLAAFTARPALVGGGEASGGGGKMWASMARVQCVLTVDSVAVELSRNEGLLVRSHSLPPLSSGEQRAIRQVWEQRLGQRAHAGGEVGGWAGVGGERGGEHSKNSAPSPSKGLTLARDVVFDAVLRHVKGPDGLDEAVKTGGERNKDARARAWGHLLDAVEGVVGRARMSALASVATADVTATTAGMAREMKAEVLRDSALLWPFLWFQSRGGEERLQPEALPRHEGGAVARWSGTTSTRSSDSSGDEDLAGHGVEGRLRCDDVLLQRVLRQRYVAQGTGEGKGAGRSASSTAKLARDVAGADMEIKGDGWHVRLLTDKESLSTDSDRAALIEHDVLAGAPFPPGPAPNPSTYPSSYPGAAVRTGPRLALFWEKPHSLEGCRQVAQSLSSALVATRSVDLVVALAAEVVAAVLSPDGICESGAWVHDVGGFEHATLHLARGHDSAAASHARRAAANLPWNKRQSLRKSAKTKVRRALSRLKGVTGLLAAAKGNLGLAALRKLQAGKVTGDMPGVDRAGNGSAGPRSPSSDRKGSEGESQGGARWNRDRVALWAAAEEKRLEEEARELVSWKGKVGLEALLLALGCGFGGRTGGEDADDGARAVLGAALCAIFGAQLSAVGAASSLRGSILRHALWRQVLAGVPLDVRTRVEELVDLLPGSARPLVRWRRAAGGPGALGEKRRRETLQRFISPLDSPVLQRYLAAAALQEDGLENRAGASGGTDSADGGRKEREDKEREIDALLSAVYTGSIAGVRKSLSHGADPLAGEFSRGVT